MIFAGILQALLSALQRASSVWPEVELRISQAIAVLAANGDHKELMFKGNLIRYACIYFAEHREPILMSLHYLIQEPEMVE